MAGGMLFSESTLIPVKLFIFIHKFYNIFKYHLFQIQILNGKIDIGL